MIADQLVGRREERRAMVRREFGLDAEVTVQVGVDDDPAGQPQRAEDVAENVHDREWMKPQSGVSVNSSGKAVIFSESGHA